MFNNIEDTLLEEKVELRDSILVQIYNYNYVVGFYLMLLKVTLIFVWSFFFILYSFFLILLFFFTKVLKKLNLYN